MAKICKFQLEKRQVSYDCGEIWEDTGEKRKIDGQEPVERYSPDCGWSDSFLYRWVEDADDYVCVGYNKYTKKHQEVSYNLGVDWEVVQGSEQPGVLVEKFSSDCCQLRTVSGETCDNLFRLVNASIEEASLDGELWIQTGRYTVNSVISAVSIDCANANNVKYIGVPAATRDEDYKTNFMYKLYNRNTYLGDYEEKWNDTGYVILGCCHNGEYSIATYDNCHVCNYYGSECEPTSSPGANPHGYYEKYDYADCGGIEEIYVFDCAENPSISTNSRTTLKKIHMSSGVTGVFKSSMIASQYGSCTALEEIEGLGNTQITDMGDSVLKGSGIKELTLPETCYHLGWTICQGCTSLSSVTFNTKFMYNTTTPTSMQNDYGQFSGCTALQTVTFPNDYNGVIYEDMFVGCTSLTSVTLGNPTVIGQGAFAGCSSLSSITLGDSISSIGECAFGCNNNTLRDVYIYSLNDVSCGTKAIPSGATIHVPCEKYAYWDNLYPGQVVGNGCGGERTISGATYCVNNDLYVDVYSQTSNDGVTWWTTATTVTLVEQGSGQCSGSYRFKVTFRNSEEETTECSATTVPSYSGNTNIASVSVGNCTTTIPDNEFRNCYYITGVDISNSVSTIGDNVFYGCSRLTSIDIPDSVTSIGDYAFNYCTGLTSCTIGSGITSIGRYAFTNCTSLTSISMAGGGTNCTINERAFNGCSGLTSVTIGDGVTIIDDDAFFDCHLTSVYIPNSVVSIGIRAFYGGVGRCTIGSGITSIGNSAFYSNNSAPNVTILATTPPTLGYNVFNSTRTFTIYVPSESVEAYKSASNWSTYASKIQAIPSENDEDDND